MVYPSRQIDCKENSTATKHLKSGGHKKHAEQMKKGVTLLGQFRNTYHEGCNQYFFWESKLPLLWRAVAPRLWYLVTATAIEVL